MGSGCGKSTDNALVTNPSTNINHVINHEFSAYLSLDNPLNVNHKYSMFFPILSNKSPLIL